MIESKVTRSDIFTGIMESIFDSYFFYVIFWLIYFIGGSFLYFSSDMDTSIEKEYFYIDSHYTFDDGEKEYHFNVIDLSEEDVEDQKQTINVTEEQYNTQCDQETFCRMISTDKQDFINGFLIFGCIVICYTEGNYLDKHKWKKFKTYY